jgi:hypothetical protein
MKNSIFGTQYEELNVELDVELIMKKLNTELGMKNSIICKCCKIQVAVVNIATSFCIANFEIRV